MDREYSTHGKDKKLLQNLFEGPETRERVRRYKHTYEDNIKTFCTEIV